MLNQLNSLAVLAARDGTDVSTYLSAVLRLLWHAEDLAPPVADGSRVSGLQVLADALAEREGQPST